MYPACIHILRDSRCTRRQEADTAACQMAVELWQYLSASCCGAAASRGLAVLGGHGLLVGGLAAFSAMAPQKFVIGKALPRALAVRFTRLLCVSASRYLPSHLVPVPLERKS